MRDCITIDRIEEERARWVDTLDEAEICRLASSFHNGYPCTVFRPRQRGAFNVCVFVEFEPTGARWVVLMPIPAMHPKVVLDEKTEIELETMRYVSAKTTIPIPKVYAYAFSDTGLNGLPFIIMDYLDGRSLKDHGFGTSDTWGRLIVGGRQTHAAKRLHQQLADIYLQLRQLEFPWIGALGLPSRDVSALSCNPEEITVCNRPLSVDMADQELDGLEPGSVFPPRRTFSTAREYVDGLLWLVDNKLDKETDQNMAEDEPASILYAAHHFKQFIQDEWLDAAADEGPFVLVHGDMEMAISNLLFDQDYNLVGVVDWEWSRVVPAQLMIPPIWLLGSNLELALIAQDSYNIQVRYLRAAVQEREKVLGLPPRLSAEWAPLETWCHTAVVMGLNCPEQAFLVYWNVVFLKVVPRSCDATEEENRQRDENEVFPRIRAFFEASKARQAFLERKVREQLEFFDVEKEHYGYKVRQQIIRRLC
ncbi:uncharacterized protein B0T15DRAFT_283026 [Chaetomium strumarium]|uniref:Aminoglycoside phosphotransferase domain-containing protein n=1 Tax=Chaetomium strumarium TaxID=1170767 RepID=A0AAJ0GPX6_9PEZI|nr:hypothetical protein B0T15DRAFT_283026 [Chaetomium strumarium]